MPLISTDLSMKRTVTNRFSFSKWTNNSKDTEFSAEDDHEEVYHRRVVHFEHECENTQEEKKGRNKAASSPNRTRRFEWNHHDFAKAIDP